MIDFLFTAEVGEVPMFLPVMFCALVVASVDEIQ